MNSKSLHLKGMKETLEESLDGYRTLLNGDVSFPYIPDFQLTPEKPNSARTVIPVTCGSEKVGDMYVIVFRNQDGTGDSNTYKLSQIDVPEHLRFSEKPEKVIPRAKTGILAEYFFPFFASNREDGMLPKMFFTHLDELVLDDNMRIRMGNILGNENPENNYECQPKIQMTTGYTHDGIRFGDSHAIYNALSTGVQVGGFIGVTDKNSPLLKVMEEVAEIPRQIYVPNN